MSRRFSLQTYGHNRLSDSSVVKKPWKQSIEARVASRSRKFAAGRDTEGDQISISHRRFPF